VLFSEALGLTLQDKKEGIGCKNHFSKKKKKNQNFFSSKNLFLMSPKYWQPG
jgi:hypothetical protein